MFDADANVGLNALVMAACIVGPFIGAALAALLGKFLFKKEEAVAE